MASAFSTIDLQFLRQSFGTCGYFMWYHFLFFWIFIIWLSGLVNRLCYSFAILHLFHRGLNQVFLLLRQLSFLVCLDESATACVSQLTPTLYHQLLELSTPKIKKVLFFFQDDEKWGQCWTCKACCAENLAIDFLISRGRIYQDNKNKQVFEKKGQTPSQSKTISRFQNSFPIPLFSFIYFLFYIYPLSSTLSRIPNFLFLPHFSFLFFTNTLFQFRSSTSYLTKRKIFAIIRVES